MPPGLKIIPLTLCAAIALHAQNGPQSLIGKGWGLDHVILVQRSADDARKIFGAELGFSIVSGNKFPEEGLENGPILLPPAYLELMWVYDAGKFSATANGGELGAMMDATVRRAREEGGAIAAYNVDVSPAEDAANFLRGRGMKVSLPPSVTTVINGVQQPGPWQFLNITYEEGQAKPPAGVPGGERVGVLEYRNNGDRLTADRLRQTRERIQRDFPDARRKPGDLHANTARKLEAVWVVVSNVQEAVKQSELLGFAPGRNRTLKVLGARGREVQCGQGAVVFWAPDKKSGPLAAMLASHGPGPFGVSVRVESLSRAHEIVEQGTGRQLRIEKNHGRNSFLVPGEATGGIWVEFVQDVQE